MTVLSSTKQTKESSSVIRILFNDKNILLCLECSSHHTCYKGDAQC